MCDVNVLRTFARRRRRRSPSGPFWRRVGRLRPLRARFRPGGKVTLYSITSFALLVFALLVGRALLQGESTPRASSRSIGNLGPAISVWNARASSVHEFPLEEYIRGVVAAEMPADFHPEALKAQAVAARTYALRRLEQGGAVGRGGAHISSDFREHQAWVDEAQFVAARPRVGAQQWERIGAAVEATRGMVLTYQGEPIDALYHSTSGGYTEDAARYFEGGQPYLRAVPDPYGNHSPQHTSRVTLPLDTVLSRLGVGRSAAGNARRGEAVVRVLSRTETGRAAQVSVGGRVFTGRAVREALDLRSNWFDVTVQDDRVVFDVRGFGHGVGMPQYGADGMARAGHSYAQILAHYYPGTRLLRRY